MRVGDELNQKVNELTMYKEVLRTVPPKINELEDRKTRSKSRPGSVRWMYFQKLLIDYRKDIHKHKRESPAE
jgi:hypothetical protein